MSEFGGNGWVEWKRLVLSELERHSDELHEMKEQMNEMKTHVTRLNERLALRSGLWGAAGAMIPVAVAVALEMIF